MGSSYHENISVYDSYEQTTCVYTLCAMSFLNTSLQTLVVRLSDMSGNVTRQKLHNRVFDAYEAKALVFEAITPAQQLVMKQFKGIIPPAHPVGPPVLVDSWSELVSVHSDENLYRLLPRRCRSNSSYAVLRAICDSAGTPFTMEDRVDPLDYKVAFRGADMDIRSSFNVKSTDKLPANIWFDGILKSKNVTGLLSFHNTISTAQVSGLAGTEQFLREWITNISDSDKFRQVKELYANLLKQPTLLFIGTNVTPSRETLNIAKTKNTYIYVKKGMRYSYMS